MQKQILETPRLMIREMSLGDLDFVATLLADPEVMRYYPKCYSREEAGAWIQRQINRYAKHGHGLWLVLDELRGGYSITCTSQIVLLKALTKLSPHGDTNGFAIQAKDLDHEDRGYLRSLFEPISAQHRRSGPHLSGMGRP